MKEKLFFLVTLLSLFEVYISKSVEYLFIRVSADEQFVIAAENKTLI